jgi:hypothetical protein
MGLIEIPAEVFEEAKAKIIAQPAAQRAADAVHIKLDRYAEIIGKASLFALSNMDQPEVIDELLIMLDRGEIKDVRELAFLSSCIGQAIMGRLLQEGLLAMDPKTGFLGVKDVDIASHNDSH